MEKAAPRDVERIIGFYTDKYDEDSRLDRHRTEFITTTYILNKVIGTESQVLDIGAGTGIYSIYYAGRGCSVTALDLVPKHVEILNSKLGALQNLRVSAEVGDARDLSRFQEDSFDVVLCMGPICHLEADEIDNCVRECLRVLRSGGIFAASYANRYEGYESDRYKEFFAFHTPDAIDQLLRSYGIEPICNVPTDGAPFDDLIESRLGDLQEPHAWLDKHQSVFNRLADRFAHGLYVGRNGS